MKEQSYKEKNRHTINGKNYSQNTNTQVQQRKNKKELKTPEIINPHKKIIYIIKQTLNLEPDMNLGQRMQEKKEKIIKEICDLQSHIYDSMYLIQNQNFNNDSSIDVQSVNIIDEQIMKKLNFVANIEMSILKMIDEQFMRKLEKFFEYKKKQLSKQNKDFEKKNYFQFFNKLFDPQNQELMQQIFQLHQAQTKLLDKNMQCIGLLLQNFQPESNLLLHSSSILQSIFCQEYEESLILDFPKFVYINLTGRETRDNLGFWREFNYYYQNYCYYFSIYWCNHAKTTFDQVKEDLKPSIRQIVIPYYQTQNVQINAFEIMMIFKLFIRPKLSQFKPIIIYVDICNTEYFEITPYALQKLFRKLRKYGKVVFHIKFDMESNNLKNSSLNFLRVLNGCMFGIKKFKQIGAEDELMLTNVSEDLEKKLISIQNNPLQFQHLKRQTHLCKINISRYTQIQQQPYFVIMKKCNNKNLIITPINQQGQKIPFQQVLISYKYQIVILLDYKNEQFYYYVENKEQIFNNNLQSQNLSINCQFKQFQGKLPWNKYGKLNHSIVIIDQCQILFVYPIISKDEIQKQYDNIYAYHLNSKDWFEIIRNQQNQNQNYDEFFDIPNTQKYIDQLRQLVIVGQTATQISEQEKLMVYGLFGGEIINSFQPMNLIEFIFLNVKDQQFYSKFLKRRDNPLRGSLKPSPYQLVLPIKINSQLFQDNHISQAYLIFRAWNQTKINYYDSMLNPKVIKKAQLLFFTDGKIKKQCKTFFLDIKYQILEKPQIPTQQPLTQQPLIPTQQPLIPTQQPLIPTQQPLIPIQTMMNSNVNWISNDDENDQQTQNEQISYQDQWKWRVIFSRFLKIKNPQYIFQKDKYNFNRKSGYQKKYSFEFLVQLHYIQNKQLNQNQPNNQDEKLQQNEINDTEKQQNQNISNTKLKTPQDQYIIQDPANWFVTTNIVWNNF